MAAVAIDDLVGQDHAIRAMSKEEILACSDLSYLAKCIDEYEERAIVLKAFLEFPAREINQNDWHRRTRGALIMFKVAIHRVEKHIKALNRASRQAPISDTDVPTTARERRDIRREPERLALAARRAVVADPMPAEAPD